MRHSLPLAALLATLMLAGCGTKGPLTLPVKPVSPNAPDSTSIRPSPATATDDLNTAKEPAR